MSLSRGGGVGGTAWEGGAGSLFSSGALRPIKGLKKRQNPTLWGPVLLEHMDIICFIHPSPVARKTTTVLFISSEHHASARLLFLLLRAVHHSL